MTDIAHSVSVRRLLPARRERVFDAFSQPEFISEWFTPGPEISVGVLAYQFFLNGEFRLRYAMPDGSRPVVGGTFDLIERPAALGFSWIWEAPDRHAGIPTRVRIELIEKAKSTEIFLTHSRLPSDDARDRYFTGWDATFVRLHGWLDHGGPQKS